MLKLVHSTPVVLEILAKIYAFTTLPYQALKLMVGKNLKDSQLQQVVDKVFQWNNKACDEMINFDEFCTIIGSADLHSKLSFDF